jgi:hypothetical protein
MTTSHTRNCGRLKDPFFLIRFQVPLLPLQANRPRFGYEPDFAFPVLHFPMLRKVVEFDVADPRDLQAAQFM